MSQLYPAQLLGLSTRTTNAAERGGRGKISALWKSYIKENTARHLNHRRHPGVIYAC